MSVSRIRQVKAAAGSGKTYALTATFLDLLGAARPESSRPACRGLRPEGYTWPEILAVTFTNKAATEMKERVLAALKRRALDLKDGQRAENLDPARAAGVVESILKRYQRLNIRTIDSLLSLLLRLFALECGLRPDFELALSDTDLFEPAYADFVGRCEARDGPERELLRAALATTLRHERRGGFRLESGLRQRLQDLIRHLSDHPGDLLIDQEDLARLMTRCREDFLRAVATMQGYLDEFALAPAANFTKFLQKCRDLSGFDEPPASAYADKPALEDCLNKAGKDKVTAACEAAYEAFKEAFAAFRRDWAALHGAYALAPAVVMAREIMDGMAEQTRKLGLVPIADLAGMVQTLLAEGRAVPEAYCRLGERLFHLLIDEFQDTSRAQWRALAPLAEECLSKGGELFYVGDVKQAIYGWRGGDSSLFEEVFAGPGPAALAEERLCRTLEQNWRSAPVVVAHNNAFFTALADEDLALDLAGETLGEAPAGEIAALAGDIARTFADARQELRPGYDGPEGYVRLAAVAGGLKEEVQARILDGLEALVRELGARRPWRDLAVLVRTREQAGLVCERLVSLEIPVVTESSLLLARHPVVRQLAAFLAFLDFPSDDLAFLATAAGPVFQRAAGLTPAAFSAWLMGQRPGGLGLRFRDDFPELWAAQIKPFFDQAGLLTPYDLARAAVERFRVLDFEPGAELHVRRFLEVVHLAEQNGCRSLSAFLDFWRGEGAEEKVPLPEHLDAVQVLTIHKAKGLEFPVAVVPFHDWPVQVQDEFTALEVRGRRVLAPLRSSLGPIYRERLAREAREQLHLLYVAWTRAREELYGFFPAEEPDKRRPPALSALVRLLPLAEGQTVFERGAPPPGQAQVRPAPPAATEPAPAELPEDLTGWLPRLRIFRHALEDVFYDERRRGEIAHRALELLRPTGDHATDARQAARLALLDFPHLAEADAGLEETVAGMLAWVLSRDDLRPLLASGMTEAQFLDVGGEVRRCDRLVLFPDEAVVLEYKTGHEDPEHPAQVRRYLELARALRPRARGLLVYLDRRLVREVLP